MSREPDYQQIDGILPNEIANYFDGVSRHDHGLDVHGMHRRTYPTMLGELPEVAVGLVLLLAKFVDYLRMTRLTVTYITLENVT